MQNISFAGGHAAHMTLIGRDGEPQILRKYYTARRIPPTPLPASEAQFTLDEVIRYYRVLRDEARIPVPESSFYLIACGMGAVLVSESEFLGIANCADTLIKSATLPDIIRVAEAMCDTLSCIDKLHAEGLGDDELVIGVTATPANLVFARGQAFYVDFYPARFRISLQGVRLSDTEVMIDGCRPWDEQRRSRVLHYFYTRSGLWLLWLGHVMTLTEANPELQPHSPQSSQAVFDAIVERLDANGLQARAQYVLKLVQSAQFVALRESLRDRHRWYHETHGMQLSRQNVYTTARYTDVPGLVAPTDPIASQAG